jgi:hypothetical protein
VRLRGPSDGRARLTRAVGFKLFALTAVVFAVVAAGCGGSKKKSAGPTTSTSAAAPKFATAKNCAQLEALGTKLAQSLQATSGSTETKLENEVTIFHQFANAAPSDVRGDFQTLADALDTYVHTLLKAGVKAGQVPTPAQIAKIQAATKAFSTPKLRAAQRHLSAWAQKNCGAAPTTTG